MKQLNFQDHPDAKEALNRIYKGMILVIILMIIVLIVSTASTIAALGGNCDHAHRIGIVTEDGTIRYIQGEFQYLSLSDIGISEGQLSPGDEISLCFDSITDEFIQVCPDPVDKSAQNTTIFISLFSSFGFSLALILGYLLFCRFTSYGRAYYEYLKEQKEKDKEPIPLIVRLITTVVSAVIALLAVASLISNLADNIQRYQRIRDRSDIIHGAADAADGLSEDMNKVEEALKSTTANEAAAEASEAAGNIWDILNEINDTEANGGK